MPSASSEMQYAAASSERERTEGFCAFEAARIQCLNIQELYLHHTQCSQQDPDHMQRL